MLRIPIPQSPINLEMTRVQSMLMKLLRHHTMDHLITSSQVSTLMQQHILRLARSLRLTTDQMLRIALYYLHLYLKNETTRGKEEYCHEYYMVKNVRDLRMLYAACCVLAAKMYHDYDLRCTCSFIFNSLNFVGENLSHLNSVERNVFEYLDGELVITTDQLDLFTDQFYTNQQLSSTVPDVFKFTNMILSE